MAAIIRKELADYFGGIRAVLLLLMVLLVSIATFYADQQIRGSGSGTYLFLNLYITQIKNSPSMIGDSSFIGLMASYFIPLIGIALGFNAINSERSNRTLSRLVSQPIYRDSIINGKFLAGIIMMAIAVMTAVLIVAGYGLFSFDLRGIGFNLLGVGVPPPSAEEIIRLFFYVVITVIYGGFWMALAILFSVVFKNVATSLLLTIIIWLFFTPLFWGNMIAPNIADALAPTASGTGADVIRNSNLHLMLLRFSPNMLFGEATQILLNPVYGSILNIFGAIAAGQTTVPMLNYLTLGQSLKSIWPHIVSLIGVSALCFGISYVVFMKQEVRAA
jgi:ABC-2 type transport system permease protein